MFRLIILIVAGLLLFPVNSMAAFPAVPDYVWPDYVNAAGAEGFLSLWIEGGSLYMNIAPKVGGFTLDGTRFAVTQGGIAYNVRLVTDTGATFGGVVSTATTFNITCTAAQTTCFDTLGQVQVTFHGTVDYVASVIAYDGGAGGATFPRSGWWWNPAETGRGISIEIQGTTLFLAWYAYDETTGKSTWISSGGPMTDADHYVGRMLRYQNGQCIGCPYVVPDLPEDVGEIAITFTDDATATLTAPAQGVSMTIKRFVFGVTQ